MPYHPFKKKILTRKVPADAIAGLHALDPLLRRIYAARQITELAEIDHSLASLPAPAELSGMADMVAALVDAIQTDRSVLVIGDYDADGATATAVAVRGLRALGLRRIDYLVPNRFEYGYGLSPEIVQLAARSGPDLLLTVDNGIASIDGVARANALGIDVLITDHHLVGEALPQAKAIVNPNCPGDRFPSKALSGVGVMFYVLAAVRSRLRDCGWFGPPQRRSLPNLGTLLDLVAVGTVADVVPLDRVNRILVHQGLQRIRAGQAQPGILALLAAAGCPPRRVTAADLGFLIAPRLNAAGRLDDMRLGIECLLTEDGGRAATLAAQLDDLNRDRREIELQMKREALNQLDTLEDRLPDQAGLCLFDEGWHEGVVGLVASRIKDRLQRPVIAFAPAASDEGLLKGSARSIPGVHVRDVLAEIATRHSGLLSRFGGHAMAAGLSLQRARLDDFAAAFDAACQRRLEGIDLEPALHSDGELDASDFSPELAESLRQTGPWGQGFPEPTFHGEFEVLAGRVVADRHLKLMVRPVGSDRRLEAIAFSVDEPGDWLGRSPLRLAYRLDLDEYRGERRLQLRIDYMEAD